MIETRCRICRGPLSVQEPPDFREVCEASAARRNDESRERIARERFARIQSSSKAARDPMPRPTVVTADEIREMWIASLCHNRCSDNRNKRLLLEDAIARRVAWLTAHPSDENGPRVRERLTASLRAWTGTVAREYGKEFVMDIPEFTENLLEHSDNIGAVMKCARDAVRERCEQMRMQNED